MRSLVLTFRNVVVGLGFSVALAGAIPNKVLASGTCCTECTCRNLCCTSDVCGPAGGGQSCDSSGCSFWCHPLYAESFNCIDYCPPGL